MKKLLTLLGAVLLVFILVACEDVAPVELDDESLGAEGPSLNDLVGTWTGSEVATETDRDTTVTLGGTTNGGDTRTTVGITTSTWNYSLEIAEGTGDAAATFTLSVTETFVNPGLLLSSSTTSGTTVTDVDYSTISQINFNGLANAEADNILNTYVGDIGSQNASGAATATTDSQNDFGASAAQNSSAVPVALTFSGNPVVVTYTGTVVETQTYDASLGRSVRSFYFDIDSVSNVGLLDAGLNGTTTTTPSIGFDTTTVTSDDNDGFFVFPEGLDADFVRDHETNEWILLGVDEIGADFGEGLRLPE